SMTGFGRGEGSNFDYHISCEIRGVNHRYFDFNLRMPKRYNNLEERIREKVKQYVSRGRVELYLNVEKTEGAGRGLKVDKKLAMIYHNSLIDLAESLKIAPAFTIMDIFRLPEVYALDEKEEDLEMLWTVVEEALDSALSGFLDMRIREGQALTNHIRGKNQFILDTVEVIAERAPVVVQNHAERMTQRLQELCLDGVVDENRLLNEIAIFADRASIDEELVRLRSHCDQMEDMLASEEPVGRKCDFLVQEMFREVNTIASKANDLIISKTAVELKAELEKIREQIQNVE
ncbi:MAG: YicC family protein, partial [Syntrophomonadaceae bacterium]|nr:YicC family protein [Syntrophomonadaceae bacterium]